MQQCLNETYYKDMEVWEDIPRVCTVVQPLNGVVHEQNEALSHTFRGHDFDCSRVTMTVSFVSKF